MGRRVAWVKESGAATTVTPRHSRWGEAVDPFTFLFLPLATPPAASREVVLPGRRPDCPPRAGDTFKPWNNEFTKYGGMP